MLSKIKINNNKKIIRLDKFIDLALYKKYGYYLNKIPIGEKFDFVTSPEISQMFGEIIGVYLLYHWKEKIYSKFNLIELGPGNGTLFKDIERTAQILPNFFANADVNLIEINKELRKIQERNLNYFTLSKIKWSKVLSFKSKLPSIIYSNEFFDCFPVRQFLNNNNHWFERYVKFNEKESKYYSIYKRVNSKKILDYLSKYEKQKIYEVSYSRNKYFEQICKYLKKNRGICILIDYGYNEKIKNFTLQSIYNHKKTSIFENIGQQDISSHVNFGELIEIAKQNKLKINEFISQRDFLIKYGILQRKKKLLTKKSNLKKNLIHEEVDRLINVDRMGKLFKCLVVSNL
ncbi:SAM-dependent methyltransferase [Pelagibacteraceae bacterium]|nr:SAM-dependent methyltransferase [Pelagibacteraceae bacterium]